MLIPALVSTVIAYSSFTTALPIEPEPILLSEHEISLEQRQPDKAINSVFKDNILLNLAYLRGTVSKKEDINWDEVRKPFEDEFILKSGETFAFHEDVLAEYKLSLVRTSNAHFNGTEGFKHDGYLMGNGVCHLASLINWVAQDALLETKAPRNHDFAAIPEIDKKYGVAIYFEPGSSSSNNQQNLYVKNNRENDLIFRFKYSEEKLKLSILEKN